MARRHFDNFIFAYKLFRAQKTKFELRRYFLAKIFGRVGIELARKLFGDFRRFKSKRSATRGLLGSRGTGGREV